MRFVWLAALAFLCPGLAFAQGCSTDNLSACPSPPYNAVTLQSLKQGTTTITLPASGLVVGTTDAQTLTNKTLTKPTITYGGVAATNLQAATYTVAPFGAPYIANFYCTATDCGAAFTAAFTAAKSSVGGAIGAKIRAPSGLYPFTSTVHVCDLDSVVVEGDAPMAMWGTGGTVFSQNANVEMFTVCLTTNTPKAITFRGIHFLNNASATSAMVHTVNAFDVQFKDDYFELANPAIIAERPWDWWIEDSNFRNCGSSSIACIQLLASTVASDGAPVGSNGSGITITNNRFEDRTGASIYSAPITAGPMNAARIIGNKFEGIATEGYPILSGSLQFSLLEGNTAYYADSNFITLDSNSSGNTIIGNLFQAGTAPEISLAGNTNNVSYNQFQIPTGSYAGHIVLQSGAFENRVTGNEQSAGDTIPVLDDLGNSTILCDPATRSSAGCTAPGAFPTTTAVGTPAAGYIGNYVTSTSSAVSLVSGTSKTITSISLPAGNWDVHGTVAFAPAGTTTSTQFASSISQTNNTPPSGIVAEGSAFLSTVANPAGQAPELPTGTIHLHLTTTTTIYLVGYSVFTISTMQAYGIISAVLTP